MHPQTKKSESSQTGCIKYHRRYPGYPVNKVPTINNNLKVRSDFYWYHFYLPVIQNILPQWCDQCSLSVWQKISQKFRGNQYIGMTWQVKSHSGYQQILQICCAHPKTTKYWKWWTRFLKIGEKSQDNNKLVIHKTIINERWNQITDMIQVFFPLFQDS